MSIPNQPLNNTVNRSVKLDQFWEVIVEQKVTYKLRVKAVGRINAKKKALHWIELGLGNRPKQEMKVSANAAYDQWSKE